MVIIKPEIGIEENVLHGSKNLVVHATEFSGDTSTTALNKIWLAPHTMDLLT
jgi:hypothetical protein